MTNSSDFSVQSDLGDWNLVTPGGSSAAWGASGTDGFLTLDTPDGVFDAWGENTSARAVQAIADEDFMLSARFLSTPTERFQSQGLLVEQDSGTYLRFDTYSNGKKLFAFGAITIDGESTVAFSVRIPGGVAPYLSVSRVGDTYTMSYSLDGETWQVAGSLTQAIDVTQAGVFAGNVGDADGFTARVDWIEFGSDPIIGEDAALNAAPVAGDDALQTGFETDLVIDAASDLLINDSDPEGVALTITGIGIPEFGTLTDNGDGTFTYVPTDGFSGTDTFEYTVSDGLSNVTATATVEVDTGSGGSGGLSDDFSGATLDDQWTVTTPGSSSWSLATTGGDAVLQLVTPDGIYDAWGTNTTARAVQAVADEDLTLEVRFLSTPVQGYEMQGLLFEQDADTWMRFDTHSDGSRLYAFAAYSDGGTNTVLFQVTIAGGSAPFLRVERVGDTWTFLYSQDGANWSVAGSAMQALTLTGAGVFGGNVGGSDGFTAVVDYFEFGDDPILSEDGATPPPDAPPVTGDDQLATDPDTPLEFNPDTFLVNDSDPEGATLTIVSLGTPGVGTLTDNGDGTFTYVPTDGFSGTDSFEYVVTDGQNETTGTVSVMVGDPPVKTGLSDDFSGAALSDFWTSITPGTGSVALGVQGSDGVIALTAVGSQDPWGQNNSTRLMQDIDDVDLSFSARFLSTPSDQYEMQGFIIEQDVGNWLRFDTYFDGNNLIAFGAVTVNGSSQALFQTVLSGGTAPYLRVTREGDNWQLLHSQDGDNWSVAGSATVALTMTSIGIMSGNVFGGTNFTALIDWFEVDTDPLSVDDGVPFGQDPPVAVDDSYAVDPDTVLSVDAVAGVLSNDTDPDGDALSVAVLDGPDNGRLTLGVDGAFTYTPDAGFVGFDSFEYSVSDGFGGSDSATVTIEIGDVPAAFSDDFSGDLSGFWTFVGPQGTGAERGVFGTDGVLELHSGNGTFDAYNVNTTGRLMQSVENVDLQYTARFLSTPTEAFQMQGFLFEADPANWLRLDVVSNGNTLDVYGAITVNGDTTQMFRESIDPSMAEFLRATRSGDTWTLEYSANGIDWTVGGSFDFAIDLSSAGLFSGNVGGSSGFTTLVDWFESSDSPLTAEDSVVQPDAVDDVLFGLPGSAIVFDVAQDLLANDRVVGTAPVLVSISDPSSGSLLDNGDGTWTFTPASGFTGSVTVSYTISSDGITDTADLAFVIEPPAISDDFSDGVLDPVWTFLGNGGSATEGSVGLNGVVEIVAPVGEANSASVGLTVPRIVQSQPDSDFQISAGFLTEPGTSYQEHGMLVIQDDANWIRFDLAHTPGGLRLIVGVLENGQTSYPLFTPVGSGDVTDFRITRSGDDWTFETTYDGATWEVAFSLTHEMQVSEVGLFSGSTSFDREAPGYGALVDYFEISSDPLVNEDDPLTLTNLPPVPGGDIVKVDETTPTIILVSDLLGNDYDSNGDALVLDSFGQPDFGTLVNDGDGTLTYTPGGAGAFDSFTYTVSDGTDTATAEVDLVVGSPITLWYGSELSFGNLGEGQEFVNILGNVDGVVTQLYYTLNGGEIRYLSIGSDTRRLQEAGDFNIDILFSDLDGSAVDDIVTIYAVTDTGLTFTHDVTIAFEDGVAWDPNTSIDWSTVTEISDAVQIVDGLWEIGPDGLRPTELGYDRVAVLGDRSWDNFTLTTTITMHDLTNVDPRGRDGGGFAIGMLWGGHTDDPISGFQPLAGWEPGAAFFYTDRNQDGVGVLDLHPSVDFFSEIDTTSLDLDEALSYHVTVQVEQVGLYDRMFSIRIWEEGTTEPVGWTLQGVQTFDITDAPQTGSVYLNAHYFDVSFGDITVEEIIGDDILQGGSGADLLVGVDPANALPGTGETDVAAGYEGADTFVAGDADGIYYDDGIAAEAGTDDFLFIWDFTTGEDELQLHGTAADYVIETDVVDLPGGVAIWWIGESGDANELVCILNGLYDFDLTGEDVTYFGLFA